MLSDALELRLKAECGNVMVSSRHVPFLRRTAEARAVTETHLIENHYVWFVSTAW